MGIKMNAVDQKLTDLKGKNYVRKASPKNNYWFSFYVGKMQTMTNRFGNGFFLIIHGAQDVDDDYFVIPYDRVKHILTDGNTTKIDGESKDANTRTPRWSGNIVSNYLHITNSAERVDLTEYYGNRILLEQAMGHSDFEASNLPQLDAEAADTTTYDPENVSDARNRIMRTITQRRGQKKFRDSLLDAYGRKCAITGCSIVDVLEAAHITPYLGPDTNHAANGLLLRADLHTLLDCGLLAIDPATHSVMLSPGVRESPDYEGLNGQRLREPSPISAAPSRKALEQALQMFRW